MACSEVRIRIRASNSSSPWGGLRQRRLQAEPVLVQDVGRQGEVGWGVSAARPSIAPAVLSTVIVPASGRIPRRRCLRPSPRVRGAPVRPPAGVRGGERVGDVGEHQGGAVDAAVLEAVGQDPQGQGAGPVAGGDAALDRRAAEQTSCASCR